MSASGKRRRFDEFRRLLVGERVGAPLTGRLDVELLENLARERQVALGEDCASAIGLGSLLRIARDGVEQDVGVGEPQSRNASASLAVNATRRDPADRWR